MHGCMGVITTNGYQYEKVKQKRVMCLGTRRVPDSQQCCTWRSVRNLERDAIRGRNLQQRGARTGTRRVPT